MIEAPTVLILGAGSSAHSGYPLGSTLLADLCRLRGSQELDELPPPWARADAETLLTRLGRSGYSSIDAFLEANSEQAELGKFLMARELKKHEVLDRLFPPPPGDSGWYQTFFNTLLSNGTPRFAGNRVGIITFNYDRSLEAYLHTALQNRFELTAEAAADVLAELPIVHVHGVLGGYPDTPYQHKNTIAELQRIASQVSIVHELGDSSEGFCNPMFERAFDLLGTAERIYILGFGFHEDNVRRLRFFEPANLDDRIIRATSHNLYPSEKAAILDRMKPYGLTNALFAHDGTSCDTFFRAGVRLE